MSLPLSVVNSYWRKLPYFLALVTLSYLAASLRGAQTESSARFPTVCTEKFPELRGGPGIEFPALETVLWLRLVWTCSGCERLSLHHPGFHRQELWEQQGLDFLFWLEGDSCLGLVNCLFGSAWVLRWPDTALSHYFLFGWRDPVISHTFDLDFACLLILTIK